MMTMKYKHDKEVSPFTLREILVYLATQGAFDSYDIPSWGSGGTSFEEVWNALSRLGSANDQGDTDGVPEGFDQWFADYCAGKKVMDPEDIAESNEDL